MKTTSLLLGIWLLCAAGFAQAMLDAPANPEPIGSELQRQLQTGRAAGAALGQRSRLDAFYTRRGYRPLWFSAGAGGSAADQLMREIAAAGDHGLEPDDYHHAALGALLATVYREPAPARLASLELLLSDAFLQLADDLLTGRLDPHAMHRDWPFEARSADLPGRLAGAVERRAVDAELDRFAPPYPEYRRLRQALRQYRELQRAGGWPALADGPALRLGSHGDAVRKLRARLRLSGDHAALHTHTDPLAGAHAEAGHSPASGRDRTRPLRLRSPATLGPTADSLPANPEALFDTTLERAVIAFQQRHGLEPDGVVGPKTRAALNVPVEERVRQLALNLERWRWLPASLGERYILVNIAGYEMRVYEAGEPVFHSPVIVGRPDRQTPLLSSRVERLVLSPYWHVPVNIAVKDKLPLLRRNPNALRRHNIRVFGADGRELNPARIDWNGVDRRNFPYRLRQDPGPANALGKVKFLFPNRHQVYLHDTSSPRLFDASRRAFSSGCVRVARPLELAEYLLRDDPAWDAERIAATGQRKRERAVALEATMPVHLLYWTAWQDDAGRVQFRDDIYRHDGRLERTRVAQR